MLADVLATGPSPETGLVVSPVSELESELDRKASAIRSYLLHCRSSTEHLGCKPEEFVPLRLVTVGMDGKPPRLVTSRDLPSSVEYTTLSHCWGDQRPLCTTKKSLDELSVEIPSTSIPKTYFEAMRITKICGISYIWIDALCIVQDDEKEWQSQASQMAQVYRGSQVTISATQSSNSTQGCFVSNAQGLRSGEQFFRTWSDESAEKSISVRVYKGDIRSRTTSDCSLNILSTRGWTLQEQLLSLRTVACMRPELHWHCRGSYQTPDGLVFSPREMLDGNPPLHVTSLSSDFLSSPEKISLSWRAIAQDYSGRDLTYPRDKCPALIGIVRYLASLTQDTYILGLWRKTFVRDLAWLRIFDRPSVHSHEGLPSWSWLSCTGIITYEYRGRDHGTNHLQLLDFQVNWTGLPETSKLSSAYVEVRGPVREIPIRQFDEGSNHNPPYFQVFDEDLKHASKTEIPWRCSGQFDTQNTNELGVFTCILLSTRRWDTPYFRVQELFLILEPVGSETEKTYRRIGLASLKGKIPSFDTGHTQTLRLV